MNLAFKIVVYTFVLNIAAGLLIYALPDMPTEYKAIIIPIYQDTSGQNQLVEGLGGNVTLPSTTSSAANVKDILLDSFFIGKIIKLVDAIGQLLFSLPKLIYGLLLYFTPKTSPEQYLAMIGAIKTYMNTLVGLAYGLSIFFLWTGKEINK